MSLEEPIIFHVSWVLYQFEVYRAVCLRDGLDVVTLDLHQILYAKLSAQRSKHKGLIVELLNILVSLLPLGEIFLVFGDLTFDITNAHHITARVVIPFTLPHHLLVTSKDSPVVAVCLEELLIFRVDRLQDIENRLIAELYHLTMRNHFRNLESGLLEEPLLRRTEETHAFGNLAGLPVECRHPQAATVYRLVYKCIGSKPHRVRCLYVTERALY